MIRTSQVTGEGLTAVDRAIAVVEKTAATIMELQAGMELLGFFAATTSNSRYTTAAEAG